MSSNPERPAGLSPVKQALVEIRRLRQELAAERARTTQPIAVVGAGVRFPGGADTLEDYWRLLRDGIHAVGPLPSDRWDHPRHFDPDRVRPDSYYVEHGGCLADVAGFDPEFFGIAPVEAMTMDPQQRLLLETSWEALEHAGIAPGSLFGSRTGVFVGIATGDYHRLLMGGGERMDAYGTSGTAYSVAAGRIAYLLGLHGPAVALDTACSSSLVAVHLACRSLRSGESDVALAGGVNLMLTPEATVDFCSAGMLARDGRCKTFDAAADGYVRSEGCGVVVLKRLADAERDGDRILAIVRGSAVNQDGRSSGLTAPSGPAQEAVIRAALADGGLSAAELDYIEAHGTGTSLGDPIEVQAVAAVFAGPRERPLLIGSAKTNLGHLEAAAGVAGLIKAMEAVRRREIPPHLHFTTPNPHIRWDGTLSVPTTLTRLPAAAVLRAGVSSFGFSGTNAHVILESPPAAATHPPEPARALVLPLSAPSPAGLHALAGRMADFLAQRRDRFADICAVAAVGRNAFPHRLALIAADHASAERALRRWLDGEPEPAIGSGMAQARNGVAFHFEATPAAADAGRELAQRWAPAREALAAFEAALQAAGVDRDASPALASLAAQHAAAALWRAWGLAPQLTIGAGAAAPLAAHHAGMLDLATAVRLSAARCRVASATSAGGAAASVDGFAALPVEVRPVAGRAALLDLDAGRVLRADELSAAWAAPTAAALDASAASGLAARERVDVILDLGSPRLEAEVSAGPLRIAANGSERAVLESLAALYTAGVSLDWRAVVGPHERVTLPGYPFQRRRFWFTPRQQPVPAAPVSSEDSWRAAALAAGDTAQLMPVDARIDRYHEAWNALDELAAAVGHNALLALGGIDTRQARTAAEVGAAAGIAPLYTPIVRRWLDSMLRRGAAVATDGRYRAAGPLEPLDAAPLWARVEDLMAGDDAMLRYIRHAAGLAPDVLAGRVSPLESLFPNGSFELASDLYQRSAVLRYVNAIATAALHAFVAARGVQRPIRVLELGAGTGGTTASLLRALPAGRATYVYTDVSEAFFSFAAEKFGDVPFLRTALLDIERDPAEQGFAPASFDVVVASNVVHAARDLRAALRRARGLLAPGGLLLLVESTGHHDWHDITTGLIEGWQHFADDLRTDSPLLPAATWLRVLHEEGFARAEAFPPPESPLSRLKQHILLAQVDDAPATGTAADAPVIAMTVAAAGTQPVTAPPDAAAAEASDFVARLRGLVPSEREEYAASEIRACVMEVLRADPDRPPSRDARLMELGLDSLMAVRLRNLVQKRLALPKKLPSTLIFDYPTIRHIATLVVTTALGDAGQTPDAPAAAPRPTAESSGREAEIAAMSEAELEAMLERMQAEGLS